VELSFLLRSTDECEAAIELATCLLSPYPFDKIISEMRHMVMEGFKFKRKRIENPTAFTLSELVRAIRNDTPSAQKLAQASMSSKTAKEPKKPVQTNPATSTPPKSTTVPSQDANNWADHHRNFDRLSEKEQKDFFEKAGAGANDVEQSLLRKGGQLAEVLRRSLAIRHYQASLAS
jgi:hypothetical protein